MLRPPFWLHVNGQTCRIMAGSERGSGTCYSEVVVEDCYGMFDYCKRAKPQVIVDIGANIGVFSKLCSMLFPNADIYAYEPNPAPLEWLEQNAADTNISVMPVAVGDERGTARFDTSFDSTLGRISKSGDLEVTCVAASEVADARQIDLLKIDCEGGEFEILKDHSLLNRTRDFCLEYHLFEGKSMEDLSSLIEGAGHRIQSITPNLGNDMCGFLRSTRLGTS